MKKLDCKKLSCAMEEYYSVPTQINLLAPKHSLLAWLIANSKPASPSFFKTEGNTLQNEIHCEIPSEMLEAEWNSAADCFEAILYSSNSSFRHIGNEIIGYVLNTSTKGLVEVDAVGFPIDDAIIQYSLKIENNLHPEEIFCFLNTDRWVELKRNLGTTATIEVVTYGCSKFNGIILSTCEIDPFNKPSKIIVMADVSINPSVAILTTKSSFTLMHDGEKIVNLIDKAIKNNLRSYDGSGLDIGMEYKISLVQKEDKNCFLIKFR